MSAESPTNQSVERASAVLAAFVDGGGLRVGDIAARSGLGQSTTSRMLATLESLDYVERDEETGRYFLGSTVIALGGAALNQHPVYRASRPHAQQLAASLGLGANVSVRRGSTLFYLSNFEGALPPKSMTLAGQRNPLHATGMGKCLLLGLSAEERRALLPDLTPFTARTLTDHDELDRHVELVESRGYATEIEELALGRACVAAPIRDHTNAVVAALSVSGSLSTIDLAQREAELAGRVIEATDAISVALGHQSPAAPYVTNLSSPGGR